MRDKLIFQKISERSRLIDILKEIVKEGAMNEVAEDIFDQTGPDFRNDHRRVIEKLSDTGGVEKESIRMDDKK